MTVMPNGVNLTPDNNGVSRTDAASAENGPQLDALYTLWKSDPASVDAQWNAFFAGFELGCQQPPKRGAATAKAPGVGGTAAAALSETDRLRQSRVDALVSAYRRLGHQAAKIDPLNLLKRTVPELSLDYVNLSESDLDNEFEIYWSGKLSQMPLRTIIDLLKETYCGNVGIEYMHIEDYEIRRWLRSHIEEGRLRKDTLPNAEKKRVLSHLLEGELFEKFLHTRYVGQKRFSLEGGETVIPILDKIVEECPRHGVQQIVMGMAHRGRLNVLANILGKDYEFVFQRVRGELRAELRAGRWRCEVSLGLRVDRVQTSTAATRSGSASRPIPATWRRFDPIVQGKARAWERKLNDTTERRKVLPVQLHGDASFVGQGVVAETLNLSQLPKATSTGGTIHIVINNQIGFTTSPIDGASSTLLHRPSRRCWAVPIFPRQRRRSYLRRRDDPAGVRVSPAVPEGRGGRHVSAIGATATTKGDEPRFTQPLMYSAIEDHPPISDIFLRPPGEVRRHHAG